MLHQLQKIDCRLEKLSFSAPSMTDCIGGVILYDETIRQEDTKKEKDPQLILKMGSLPGIKVDTGAKVLA